MPADAPLPEDRARADALLPEDRARADALLPEDRARADALPPEDRARADALLPEERAPASVSKGGGAETAAPGPESDDWQSLLRSQGYRLTPQRELVLAAVETLGHATPDEVFAEVRRHSDSINLSTVYRTVELLDELGLIRHAHLTDRAPTYHSARGREHAHLVCRVCKKHFSVDREDVEAAFAPLAGRYGFQPDYAHLAIFGECRSCT